MTMADDQSLPTLSILLPIRNEERNLTACLERIYRNDYPHDRYRILVIDGESDDRSLEIVKEFQAKYGNIDVYDNPERLPYTALNIALEHATGDYIMRVDARSMIPENYIRTCVETLQETGADNVGGVQRQYGKSLKQKAIALTTGHKFGVGNAQFRLGGKSGFVDTVYLGCFPKHVFDRIGRFDADGPVVSEDSALNKRIRDNGGKIYLNADLIVRYPAKATFRELARQYFIYGGAKGQTFLTYRKLTAFRQLIPLAFLLGLLTSFVLAAITSFLPAIPAWPFWTLFSLGAGSYLLADALSSLQLTMQDRNVRLFPYLLVAFPCIHFPWPIGFLKRLTEGKAAGKHWRG